MSNTQNSNSLGQLLGNDELFSSSKKKGMAATVGGDQVVTKEEKGEVYIRADGKKVRKIKKTVIKKKKKATESNNDDGNHDATTKLNIIESNNSTDDDDDDNASITSYVSQGGGRKKKKKEKSKKNAESDTNEAPVRADDDDNASVVSYMSQGVKKKKKKSSKAAVVLSEASAIATAAESTNKMNSTNKDYTDDDDDGSVVSYMSTSGIKRKGKKSKKKKLLSDAAAIAAEAEKPTTDDPYRTLNCDDDDDASLVSYMSASGTRRKKTKKKKSKEINSSDPEAIATQAQSLSAISNDNNGEDPRMDDNISSTPQTTTSAGGSDDDQSLVSYMSTSGIKRKKKKSSKGKMNLDGFFNQGPPPTKFIDDNKVSSLDGSIISKSRVEAATVADSGEGEIYINKDGKKVRRVRKIKTKSTDDLPSSSLGTLLDGDLGAKVSSGPATVAGDRVATIESTSEIYINKDGKKVRRVKKTVTRVKPKDDGNGGGELANMLESGATVSKAGAATVSGATSSSHAVEGEIYINKDGKKVRRVKKVVSKADAGTSSLSQLLDNGNSGNAVGSATVSGVETEIYIRADGKKVRRVKRSPSATGSSAASLSGLSSTSQSTMVGSMSVGGDTVSEIYINKDGKKVRRIRRSPPAAVIATSDDSKQRDNTDSDTKPESISSGGIVSEGRLDDLLNIGQTPKLIGAATVAAPHSTVESEIYINKDGKKVRRIKKTSTVAQSDLSKLLDNATVSKPGVSGGATVGGDRPTLSASSDEGEIYIRADGKKVRRVRKAVTATQNKTANKETSQSLKGFLDNDELPQPRLMDSATVAGDKISAKLDGGEIVIRADGKKVIRRVKKKEEKETEVYRRADGKLVRRVKKDTKEPVQQENKAPPVPLIQLTPEEDKIALEYRKLKRMGLPDDAVRHKMTVSDVHPKIIAAVMGDKWTDPATISTEEKKKPSEADMLGFSQHLITGIQLTGGEEALAIQYRKLKNLGLPDDAVRHKMIANNVEPKIIAAVFGEEWPPQQQSTSTPLIDSPTKFSNDFGTKNDKILSVNGSDLRNEVSLSAIENATAKPSVGIVTQHINTSSLTPEEEEAANEFRKLKRFGLSDEAILRRMELSEIDPKIIRAVLGNDLSTVSSDSGSANQQNNSVVPPTSSAATEEPLLDESKGLESTTEGIVPPSENIQAFPQRNSADFSASNAAKQDMVEDERLPKAIMLSEDEELIASQYQKMQKMGLPDEVVRHKMTAMDVHPKIMAAVLGEEWNEPTLLCGASIEADASASEATSIHLTDEEEELASQFRKMQKMGLPDEVVRHKMTSIGVHPKVVAAVLKEEWNDPSISDVTPVPETTVNQTATIQLTSEDEDIAQQFRKMQKMGLPNDVVRHKMVSMEIHPKIMAAVLNEEWNDSTASTPETTEKLPTQSIQLSEEEEEAAAQFRKMQKMGLPDDVVRHKMSSMGIHPKIMAAVLGDEWTELKSFTAVTTAEKSETTSAIQLSDDEEEIAAQFRKMQKMGLPSDVVRHKMASMDIHPKIVAAVLGEEWKDQNINNGGAVAAIRLSPEEEEIATQFKKMQKMGLPNDVVRHKMTSMDIHPKIVAAVLDEPWTDPSTAVNTVPTLSSQSPLPAAASSRDTIATQSLVPVETSLTAPESGAYIVVVDGNELSNQLELAAQAAALKDTFHLNPDDKYAVKIAEGSSERTLKTKFITLADLAKMSGQSQSELESIVREKKSRGSSPPRFVLQSVAEEKFEVEITENARSPAATTTGGIQITTGGIQIKEGEEVVDSALANAARAVSALGDGDMNALIEKLRAGDMAELLARLREAEKRQKKLEKQLQQAGVAIAEDIDYAEAKSKVEQIAKRMNEIGGSDVVVEGDKELQNRLREEYFKLEQEMERYNTALMLSEEYQAEQERLAKKWETDNEADNLEALRRIRRHMPVMIRHMSEADLANKPSPNGQYLPKSIAKKFKRTNVLQCLRINPNDLERMHPCTLENMRVTGLTLTERRAVYMHLRPLGPKWEKNKAEKMTERKWTWFQMMKNNFKENLEPFLRHCAQYGPPENHPYATRDNPNSGCPLLGKQCPVRADKEYDYSGDFGYPDGDEYEVSDVKKSDVDDPGAKAKAEAAELAREKKANERADILKKHYKGKLLQVSKANGSCESMDEAMDRLENHTIKWIEFMLEKGKDETEADKKKEIANFTEALNELKLSSLDYATRTGMQTSGKKKAGGDAPDIRSSVEASLADEVFECTREFFTFITDRMKEIDMVDTRVQKAIDMLDAMWKEIHEKNTILLQSPDMKRLNRSRKLRKNSDLRKEVEAKKKPEEPPPAAEEAGPPRPPMGGGGRGGLMDSIAGRGRGGGRGGLMDAIAGRGRGRGGRAGGGGRGGLLDAIAGRGRGGGGDDGGGGRGGLLDSIKGRGGGGGGGRGDLLSAIAGRGGGRGGDGGGRGGLLAAIAARGGGDG